MQAAWYEAQGTARDVLVVGEMPDPQPAPGEVRIRLSASGINPGDLKKREDAFGIGMPYPRVIPHSDGAGVIDAVGEGVAAGRIGERVWCFGAQSYRPFGTAAQYTVVPHAQAVTMPENVMFDAGACLGIPALTAHRAVHGAGPVAGRQVLVQGGAGGVGSFAVGFARRAGAHVIATVRSAADEQVLALGGSVAAYATLDARPVIPFWNLLFKNARLLFLGSDDFPLDDKLAAAAEVNALLVDGWSGLRIDRVFPLDDIAAAHEHAEAGARGRVLVSI